MTQPHPYIIGLIGGIACGKSTALAFFKSHDIETFSADTIAKQLMSKGTLYYHKILKHLGPSILTNQEELDRTKLRHLLLHDAQFKQWLEHLLHPEIKRLLLASAEKTQSPYCVLEIPVLQDRTHYPLHQILSIESHEELQKKRLQLRNLDSIEIQGLLNIQTPKQRRLDIADDVIENNGSKEAFYKELEKKHQAYLKAAMAKN